MKAFRRFLFLGAFFFVFSVQAQVRFECGGSLEARVWNLWDQRGRHYLKAQLLERRLIGQGDVYALYDTQGYFHNLEAMARRCDRQDRLMELAEILTEAYKQLSPSIDTDPVDAAWICRGGVVCNASNRLIDKEVQLASVQGLGLMSDLANALANADAPTGRFHPFVALTAQVVEIHLRRWAGERTQMNFARLERASAQDLKPNSSELFFTDKELWQIAIYANLAGILSARPDLRAAVEKNPYAKRKMKDALRALLRFLRARTKYLDVQGSTIGAVRMAEVDKGFWGKYTDSRYAGYTGNQKPAICSGRADSEAQLIVPANDVPIVDDIGWDFSHSRRFVLAFDALQRNRTALQNVFGLLAEDFSEAGVSKNLAAQLIVKIWNGDRRAPLFSNYWSGINGWYRVAYNNGTGRCNEGVPPFGLSESFATGGFAVWSKYYPIIGELARTVYDLTDVDFQAASNYAKKNFPGLISSTSSDGRMLNQLMFWPSLIASEF